jgi:hypothetical protein
MFLLRYVALLALVLWLGAMIALGALVAPSTFRVLQASDPTAGRALAGAVFGDILRHFHLMAYGCGLVLMACFIVKKLVGPPPAAFALRLAIVVLMLVLDAYSGVWITRGIEQVQSEVSGSISSLPTTDARRERFDRLHPTSTMLMTINIGLGLVLLAWYARE